MSFQIHTPSTIKTNENGYTWYECTCCPYGYHIDLDFVRYCESICKKQDRTGSIKRRKDRRRQRQSMEVLLGITPPVFPSLEQNYKPIQEQESPKILAATPPSNFELFNDGFNDAVSDFEKTLQRSKKKVTSNLPDVTAVSASLGRALSNSSMSSASGSSMTMLPSAVDGGTTHQDFDTASVESCTLSPLALHTIREQMALSLERTKELEHQVQLIPELKDELLTLKQENRRLIQRLKTQEASNLNTVNNYMEHNRSRSHSFTHLDGLYDFSKKEPPPPPPPRKDFGVMCGVLTRNIGVGHQNPNTKSVSTTTFNDENKYYTDKWLDEKVRFMNSQNLLLNSVGDKVKVAKGTQTVLEREKSEIGVQFSPVVKPNWTQISEAKKTSKTVATLASTTTSDFTVQKTVECYSIGCSDDTINDIICEKCNAFKRSVAVGDETSSLISLASLAVRSKSFHLGEDKLNLARTRTIACQYQPNNSSRACQTPSPVQKKTSSKTTQSELKIQSEKQTQCQYDQATKNTDTKDLVPPKKHVGCEAKEVKISVKDVGCNTSYVKEKSCSGCASKELEEQAARKDGGSPTPSRIPRPQIPTTPVENRKFKRQDTYTKIYPGPEKMTPFVPRLSGLDLPPKTISNEVNPLDKVKQDLQITETVAAPQTQTPITKVQIHASTLPVSETTLLQPIGQSQQHNRKKATPSKEMQGAMKVLNDSLQKNPSTKNLKNHSAINIVQQEWFKISSLVTANPLDVEDYLDAFEDISSILLQYIVNMTDASGNTAMHYAVSHGNFDVVSILLDSKVCDINQANKAGYTSIMLVSLAKVKSQTHANVVKRLFQLADVNIRAKQHGQTALMLAVSHGQLDMVKMLLEAGADINIQDEDGSTALMCAAEHGHMEIVRHFLSQPDCDSSITDVDGSTALKIAMEAGHRHIGVLLYAHERNYQKLHGNKIKKTKSLSPKTPSSPLPTRSSHRALTDTKTMNK